MSALVGGTLPLPVYGRLVTQYLTVYRALEDAFPRLAADPVAGPFVDDRLRRAERLAADARALDADPTVLPATAGYAARIRELADRPAQWVAHHYVRYLGDLSGGQIIRRALAVHYDGAASEFYDFDALGPAPHYRTIYRQRLDALVLDDGEAEAMLEEARGAFELTIRLFAELAG